MNPKRAAVLGLAFTILLLQPIPGAAGPNFGGVLIVHDTGYNFTSWNQLPPPPGDPPATCEETDNEMPCPLGSYEYRAFRVYAAFPDASSPRLKALTFGSAVSGSAYVLYWGLPDPAHDFEIAQGGWPYANGGGVGISFGTVKTALISEVYWLGGYSYECDGIWSTAPHPVQESVFVDDAVPPQVDPILAFSSIGFGLPGTTHCFGPPVGACCLPDGLCQVMLAASCAEAGGTWLGPGTGCDPNPCEPVPTEATSWGRVKDRYR